MAEESADRPIWARPEAFPAAEPGWGWVDRKGRRHPCQRFDELAEAIVVDAGAQVDLVWTPASGHLVLPEEIGELHPAMKGARIRWAEWEIEEGRRQMMIFGVFALGICLFSVLMGEEIMAFGPFGLALLLLLVLGFIPWYQGKKRLRRARAWVADGTINNLDEIRFETWLLHQRTPLTKGLLALVTICALVQWLAPGDLVQSLAKAGLTKIDGRVTDWWRLATAPFLHGHWIHFLFNAAALAYLGRRMEVLARWPHVALVFVLSGWLGGEASARFVAAPSIGASGALLGMLGFLLVFESMNRRLVPDSSRRRLIAGVLLTAVIGVIGFRFIDNAAHGGGLLGGMIYAAVVFPKSSSSHRPEQTKVDWVFGALAVAVIVAAAVLTCVKLLA